MYTLNNYPKGKPMRFFNIVLLLIVLIISIANAQRQKLNIAVNDISVKGVEVENVDIITDLLCSELINSRAFRVMERKEMNLVLKEQAFIQSGACEENSCLVEIGKVLGVDRMIAGSVGKLNLNNYLLNIRMINVSTGEILHSINESYEGDIKGLLFGVITKAAEKLTKAVLNELDVISLVGKKGDIRITTSLKGASIKINNKEVDGKTPFTLNGIQAGELKISAEKENYHGTITTFMYPDDLLKVDIQMKLKTGILKIFSKPDSATVFINDINKGTTPLKIDNLAVGEYGIVIIKNDFITNSEKVEINVDEILNKTINLKPASYAYISANPKDLTLEVNGKRMDSINIITVPSGNVTFKALKEKYNEQVTDIFFKHGERKQISFKLERSAEYLKKRKKITKWVRRISFGGSAVGFGIAALLSNNKAEADLNKATEIQAEYDNVIGNFSGESYSIKYNEFSNSADENIRNRNLFAGIAGGSLLAFTISIPF